VPFRDINGDRMTPEEVLELAREIECETGQRLIFGVANGAPPAEQLLACCVLRMFDF